jgi:DNA invertase Pin-like site-specific DNA recombinase
MLRERTKIGLETARREERIGGRPPKLTHLQQSEIVRMISRGRKTAANAVRLFGVHPATISRLLARAHASGDIRHAKPRTAFYHLASHR